MPARSPPICARARAEFARARLAAKVSVAIDGGGALDLERRRRRAAARRSVRMAASFASALAATAASARNSAPFRRATASMPSRVCSKSWRSAAAMPARATSSRRKASPRSAPPSPTCSSLPRHLACAAMSGTSPSAYIGCATVVGLRRRPRLRPRRRNVAATIGRSRRSGRSERDARGAGPGAHDRRPDAKTASSLRRRGERSALSCAPTIRAGM